MKKLFVLLCLLTFVPVCVFAETSEFDQFETIKTLLEMIFKETNNGDVDISCNDSGFVIRQTNKGFTDTLLATYIFHAQATKTIQKESQESLLDFYNGIYEFLEACGIEDPNLLYMITDPTEPDEGDMIFIAISNGEIIYDMLSE